MRALSIGGIRIGAAALAAGAPGCDACAPPSPANAVPVDAAPPRDTEADPTARDAGSMLTEDQALDRLTELPEIKNSAAYYHDVTDGGQGVQFFPVAGPASRCRAGAHDCRWVFQVGEVHFRPWTWAVDAWTGAVFVNELVWGDDVTFVPYAELDTKRGEVERGQKAEERGVNADAAVTPP